MNEMLLDPTFWVGVGLVIFIAILIYVKVPGLLARQLDARSAAIAGELNEAKRLREEAEALLATYQARTKDAESEAAAIIATAKTEAQQMQAEARDAVTALIERRTKMAEHKIAQAEATALAEVKTAAAGAAVSAATQILSQRMDGAKATAVADSAIRDLRSRLN
ncbi:MAG: F0F1 ATP synthase subunit B [Alphaproteobacteria bacterium]|nr:F0F1 ATP synthase subunit B [Alphaproteobacteria bacterium]